MLLSVCVCTYKRPQWLRRLLLDLAIQNPRDEFSFEIVVVDNDAAESGRPVIAEITDKLAVPIIYSVEPRRSISYVRNETLRCAKGEAIVFIDDDEFPDKDWLYNLFVCWRKFKVAGVLGSVRPWYENGAPQWVKVGGFYDRPEYATGHIMPWEECRTGNVLFDRSIISGIDPVFRPEFGTGGGDVDFFRRMMGNGHKFVWCNEAAVFEIVPPSRWDRKVMIKRALLRGQNSFRHPAKRWFNVSKAILAVPLYTLILPFAQLAGHHAFMKYLIKLCNHTGRLLAAIGLRPVSERAM